MATTVARRADIIGQTQGAVAFGQREIVFHVAIISAPCNNVAHRPHKRTGGLNFLKEA